MRHLTSSLLLAVLASSGCMAANWNAALVDDLDIELEHAEAEVAREYEFDRDLPAEEILSGHSPEGTRELLLKTPPGSQVIVYDDSNRTYSGAVLRATPDTLELKSCLCKETIPGPNGQLQCKTSFIPFQTLSMPTLRRYVLVSWPEQAASDETGDLVIEEIIFMNGRRQRWGKPRAADPSDEQTGTATIETE